MFASRLLPATLVTLTSAIASAQQSTFHLDRLEVPGAPDDGLVLFRPRTQQDPVVFGQLAFGYSLHPLRTRTITSDPLVRERSSVGVVDYQFTTYATIGFQFLERLTLAATLPATLVQGGQNPNYGAPSAIAAGTRTTAVDTGGPALGDTRLDLRGVVLRGAQAALGAQVSVFAPTGNGSVTNFGGNGQTSAMFLVSGEYDLRFMSLVANTGIHLRPRATINDPVRNSGLGIGNEWRWAVGAFIPFRQGKYRLGATLFGQTGLDSDAIIGDTTFTSRNTPIEWNVEGRMKFGKDDRFWVGAGAGSFVLTGYGAPDLRVVALVGTSVPLADSHAPAPDPRLEMRKKWRAEHRGDADHDGIPDDIDACPNEPEDGKGADPTDGCPQLPDRDGDGIPDQWDKCPDEAEDKDGIEDGDGCPEVDYDADGIPDTQDACPKEPGQPSSDPKHNGCPQYIKMEGGAIRILQQVHFKTGSSTILPDSFPMLQEIANVLKANQGIKRLAVEGHTDNRGGADLNMRLSQARAESVVRWLTEHGIDGGRLEAHGYGMTQPIDTNSTDAGRAANRRVEFKIVEEVDTNKPQNPSGKPPAPEHP